MYSYEYIINGRVRRNFVEIASDSKAFLLFPPLVRLLQPLKLMTMRSFVILAAALCLVIAAPGMAMEEERELQSIEPSMTPPLAEDTMIPTATPAPSAAESLGAAGATAMPTEEPTSGSFKTVTAVAGAATLCAFAGYF